MSKANHTLTQYRRDCPKNFNKSTRTHGYSRFIELKLSDRMGSALDITPRKIVRSRVQIPGAMTHVVKPSRSGEDILVYVLPWEEAKEWQLRRGDKYHRHEAGLHKRGDCKDLLLPKALCRLMGQPLRFGAADAIA